MDSLVGYGSDDDNDYDRHGHQLNSVSTAAPATKSREEDNYDAVNMDLSEDSQAESEPELPQAEPAPASRHNNHDRRRSDSSREREPDRRDRSDRRRESPRPKDKYRRDDRHRSDREKGERRGEGGSSRRGLLGDRPDDRSDKMPSLMDVKPFSGEGPSSHSRSQDARDAVSPRFMERDRREKDRERERDRDRHSSRRSEEKRSGYRREDRDRERRSRSRGAAFPPPSVGNFSASGDRRHSPPSGDYRPSSYKVNKKLEVMEKMGLQIKTPDGSMATVQQLRAASSQPASHAARPLDQVQKRKLLWSKKASSSVEEAGKWTGARFAQDDDGRQANKFLRLMGIKDPVAAAAAEAGAGGAGGTGGTGGTGATQPALAQEELFSAMQAQYEVARATTHTMRGLGLGFQRNHF